MLMILLQTALIIAAIRDQADAARLLLEAGANPHACDVHGLVRFRSSIAFFTLLLQNALMVAAVRGNVHATASLLEFGADVESKDSQFGRVWPPMLPAADACFSDAADVCRTWWQCRSSPVVARSKGFSDGRR